jgi:hypothetical protein
MARTPAGDLVCLRCETVLEPEAEAEREARSW